MCLTEIPEQVETAVAYAEQALDLAPNDPTILDTLGVAYLRNSQPEQAIGYIQQAIGIKKEPRYLFICCSPMKTWVGRKSTKTLGICSIKSA